MASQSNAVTLKRGGRSHDMQPQQVTMENLRRVFKVCNSDKVLKYNSLLRSFHSFTQVDPSEAWLQDECDGTAHFPQEGGQFNLHSLGLAPYATLIVECPEITASMPSPRTSNLPPPTRLYPHFLLHRFVR